MYYSKWAKMSAFPQNEVFSTNRNTIHLDKHLSFSPTNHTLEEKLHPILIRHFSLFFPRGFKKIFIKSQGWSQIVAHYIVKSLLGQQTDFWMPVFTKARWINNGSQHVLRNLRKSPVVFLLIIIPQRRNYKHSLPLLRVIR